MVFSANIQKPIERLTKIYDSVEGSTDHYLSPTDIYRFSMECEELKLKEDGTYDGPASKPTFFDPSTPNVRDYNSHLADDWYRSY